MTTNQTTKRPTRDPLKVLVDLDSLRLGHQLALKGAVAWPAGFVPQRPLGRVAFEGARQLATFVVPLVLMVGAYWQGGLTTALQMALVALAAGYLLDKQLTWAIARKKARDVEADNGVYATARELAVRLGLRLEDISAARVARLHEDFLLEERRLLPYAIEGYAKGLAEGEQMKREQHARMLAEGRVRAEERANAAAHQAATRGGNRRNRDYADPAFDSGYSTPMVNTDGTPMISGTYIDVTGKTYGES